MRWVLIIIVTIVNKIIQEAQELAHVQGVNRPVRYPTQQLMRPSLSKSHSVTEIRPIRRTSSEQLASNGNGEGNA